jgi:hypothetical protein
MEDLTQHKIGCGTKIAYPLIEAMRIPGNNQKVITPESQRGVKQFINHLGGFILYLIFF